MGRNGPAIKLLKAVIYNRFFYLHQWSIQKMIRFLQTPGRTKKIVLGGVLLVICGAMVITLVPGGILGGSSSFGGTRGMSQNVIAEVGGREISVSEAQKMARNMGRRQFRGNLPEALMPFLVQRATEQLIMQDALLTEASRMGLHVSDAELQDELQHGHYAGTFFPEGKFIGQQAYEDLLSQNDLTVGQFEQGVKDDLLREKLQDLVTGAVAVSPSEVEEQFQKENAKVKFDYAVLNSDELKKQIHPSDAELKSFYDQNKQRYENSIPEKRKLRYVLVDSGKLASQIKVSDAELQRYYNQHADEFRQPEQVNVRHILIKTPVAGPDGKVDQKAVDAAKQKSEDILKQLKAGGNFADLAKKYSEDPGSAKNGGSLGWIQRGRTVPEFEQAAFSLPVGQTSDLVRSSYGFHIIHVDEKQDAHMKTLAEVKSQIEPVIAQDMATQQAQTLADKVGSQARTLGIDKAASQNGLPVTVTDFVSRTDALPGLGPTPEFMDAAFSAKEKSPPDMTNLKQGYVIYEVLAVTPAATPSFQDIRSKVENEFLNERANTLLTQKTQELSDRARAQHDLKKVAKEMGASLKTSELVTPHDSVPDVGSMSGQANAAFSMKVGEISGPIQNGNNGAVLQLLDKQQPSQADFEKDKDKIREQLADQKRQEMFELFVGSVRQQMEKSGKIRINEQVMKQLAAPRTQAGS